MHSFKTLERRISANPEQTKFRVQYKKNGKARANILSSIEKARELRDATDTPETKKQIKAGTMRDTPAATKPILMMKKETSGLAEKPQKPKMMSFAQLDMSEASSDATTNKKLDTINRYFDIVEKILNS